MTTAIATITVNRVVFLQGFKTVLRPLNKETDLDICVRAMNDPELSQFLKRHHPCTRMDEVKWFDNLSGRESDLILAIEDISKPGIMIGSMGLHKINWIDRRAISGAWMIKEYWGKGFGTDAKMHLLDYAFNTLNLHKICSAAFAFNNRSVAYNNKCGYETEATLKNHIFRNGQYWDEILLAVFKERWLPIWEYYKSHNGQFQPNPPPKPDTGDWRVRPGGY